MHIYYILIVVEVTVRPEFVWTHQSVHLHFVKCNLHLSKVDAKEACSPSKEQAPGSCKSMQENSHFWENPLLVMERWAAGAQSAKMLRQDPGQVTSYEPCAQPTWLDDSSDRWLLSWMRNWSQGPANCVQKHSSRALSLPGGDLLPGEHFQPQTDVGGQENVQLFLPQPCKLAFV